MDEMDHVHLRSFEAEREREKEKVKRIFPLTLVSRSVCRKGPSSLPLPFPLLFTPLSATHMMCLSVTDGNGHDRICMCVCVCVCLCSAREKE